MTKFRRSYLIFCTILFVLGAILFAVLAINGDFNPGGPLLILFFGCLALYFMGHPKLKTYAFTIWVFAAVAASMIYPSAFDKWFGFDLAVLIVPLIQII
ncbi:MAG: hypothetical protein ACP5E3_13470, partial [Bacteroidales bacterium]